MPSTADRLRTGSRPLERRYGDPDSLALELADIIAAELCSALRRRHRASLVVSGGSTPLPLFRELRERAIPWARVDVLLADERWVTTDDAHSNARLVRSELLQGRAEAARLFELACDTASPAESARMGTQLLHDLLDRLDVVVLGMGGDGHFASLFPESPGLVDALKLDASPAYVAMQASVPPVERISMNRAALYRGRRLVLHITGANKWAVYESARDGRVDLPITTLLRQAGRPIEVHWAP